MDIDLPIENNITNNDINYNRTNEEYTNTDGSTLSGSNLRRSQVRSVNNTENLNNHTLTNSDILTNHPDTFNVVNLDLMQVDDDLDINKQTNENSQYKRLSDLNNKMIDELLRTSSYVNFSGITLSPESSKDLYNFKNSLEKKVSEYIRIIEHRREQVSQELRKDNQRIRQSNSQSNSEIASYINKLERIKLRAAETETVELQRVRTNFIQLIELFKLKFETYITNLQEGNNAQNPTKSFIEWLDSLNPYVSSQFLQQTQLQNSLPKGNNIENDVNTNLKLYSSPNSFSNIAFSKLKNPIRMVNSNIFPLNSLPPEILGLVLEKVNSTYNIVKLFSVCKLWAELIVKIIYYRPHINKKYQLDIFMRTMLLPKSRTVFDYRAMIKRLNFSFVGDYLHDEELYHFVGCKNLERLTLVFCKNITSNSISAVLEGCRYLQSIDITGIKEISDNIFGTLANNCPRLQGFYVPQARNISFNSLHNFISRVSILKRVKITANNEINDELVELLANKCPLLVEVDITQCPNVHDSSLLTLFTKLTQLREFRNTHNTNITDKAFLEITKKIQNLPSLRLLDLSGCENITDKTIERVVSLAPKLRNVFLGKCSRITDISLFQLAKLGKNLQTIHFGHCFNITDQGVRVLVQTCPRIQYVDFACCTNLTNRTLYELADLSKLKRIGLVKCTQITDEGLLNMISLRGRNDTLERVHLSYCSNLTIYPIYELLMACPRLSHLSLTAVPSFLRPDITTFCRAVPTDFSENQRIIFCVFSGKGVHKLRHYLMGLTTPTDGPETDINEVLTQYITAKNLLRPDEAMEEGIRRITLDVNADSAAILAATGISQMNGINNDLLFQGIDFDRLDDIFNWYNVSYGNVTLDSSEINELLTAVDRKFCGDPFDEEYDERDGIVAPGASNNVNSELAHVIRRYNEMDDRIDDFEVNVASLARVQFQFTGFLVHEMLQIYTQMIELNRQLVDTQRIILESNITADIKGLSIFKLIFTERFRNILKKFELSSVVLRLYLRDSISVLTRQREIVLAHLTNDGEMNEDGMIRGPDDENALPIPNTNLGMLQFNNLRAQVQNENGLGGPMNILNQNRTEDISDTPEADTALEEA
ncbi:hypothetical protein TPHA_0E00560 [Tetrapisispora phaffii CBS 4417]|uniref:F-box domain-containing protein n=1 Tax=Tetrapisispora phaffii (strain ATCC 24235 / CBS 4417 / NBRC 1672 / NRRL Y-8282 / UCD 70-5) TaxID=1071381 RepID=G8BTC3_TETPH|nr:hypothetical protein TPHA_0E00560 [Tetrapisispora phaffii CBS 4417]CCE63151.1 hypothetical protein TPHA_0E00560 [Tetrapisispora phaffii CBS 4417]